MGGTSGPRSEVSRGQDNGEARPERVGEGVSFTQDGDGGDGRGGQRPSYPEAGLPSGVAARRLLRAGRSSGTRGKERCSAAVWLTSVCSGRPAVPPVAYEAKGGGLGQGVRTWPCRG